MLRDLFLFFMVCVCLVGVGTHPYWGKKPTFCSSFLILTSSHPPSTCSSLWKVKIPRKVSLLCGRFYMGESALWIVSRYILILCCPTLVFSLQPSMRGFASPSLGHCFDSFNLCLVWKRDCSAMINEVLLGSPFCDKGKVLWHASFLAIFWGSGLR